MIFCYLQCYMCDLKVSNLNWLRIYRSSRPKVFCKKGALKNFSKLTGKHLCQSLFFNKVFNKGLKPATLFKKETLAQVFFCEFYEIFIPSFLQNASGGCFWIYLQVLVVNRIYFPHLRKRKYLETLTLCHLEKHRVRWYFEILPFLFVLYFLTVMLQARFQRN